jgi:hypothetical protein
MGDGAEIHHRLHWIDDVGKPGLDRLPVDMFDAGGMAGDALDGVQDGKARPVREEIADRASLAPEDEIAIGGARDLRRIAEFLRAILGDRIVGDPEAGVTLRDREIGDLRIVGAPISVANNVGNRAEQLDAVPADVAYVARFEFRGEQACLQKDRRLHDLLGTEQPH